MEESFAEKKSRILIDEMLEKSGWKIIRKGFSIPSKGYFAVEEVETSSGPMDYALYLDEVLVGDVEAKPERTGCSIGYRLM